MQTEYILLCDARVDVINVLFKSILQPSSSFASAFLSTHTHICELITFWLASQRTFSIGSNILHSVNTLPADAATGVLLVLVLYI